MFNPAIGALAARDTINRFGSGSHGSSGKSGGGGVLSFLSLFVPLVWGYGNVPGADYPPLLRCGGAVLWSALAIYLGLAVNFKNKRGTAAITLVLIAKGLFFAMVLYPLYGWLDVAVNTSRWWVILVVGAVLLFDQVHMETKHFES